MRRHARGVSPTCRPSTWTVAKGMALTLTQPNLSTPWAGDDAATRLTATGSSPATPTTTGAAPLPAGAADRSAGLTGSTVWRWGLCSPRGAFQSAATVDREGARGVAG